MAEEMIILTRTFDLLAWLLPKSEKFPKSFRYTITQRLMNSTLDFQESLFSALSHSKSARQKYLQAADAQLNNVRLYLRLVHSWGWLNDGQYRHASVMVAEIGRLLGGWKKSLQAANG